MNAATCVPKGRSSTTCCSSTIEMRDQRALFEIFVRDRRAFFFAFPINGQDPPARSVVHKLETVDAAGEGLLVLGVTRFVGAPAVRDVVPGLNAVGDGAFEETVFGEIIPGPRGVLVRRGHARNDG